MTLTSPLFLVLFLLLPLFLWLGWPSHGPSRGREIIGLVIRLIILSSLVLSLAGLEVVRPSDELAVVFLVDASDSMPTEAKAQALFYIQQALQAMKSTDQAAIVVFGGDALVERPMSSSRRLDEFTSVPVTLETDIAEAIRLGLALFPPDAAKRLVILSDGAATTGDAEEAARLAAASGVEILVVPFLRATALPAEVLIAAVRAPDHLRQGESFNLEVTVEASRASSASLRVFADAKVVAEQTVKLNPGPNNFTIPLTAASPGFSAYRVQIVPASNGDGFYQNNELAAFSQIAGPPRVLVVGFPPGAPQGRDGVDEITPLTEALRAAGVSIDVTPPVNLPSELAALSEYASVVLVDVPARELTPRQMEALQTYVRDLGGGLVAVGGPASYGVGGYFKTPLEETLPVEMQIKDEVRRPRLTLVLVIDHSGSMADSSGGAQKIELAKEAAIRSVELLNPGDRVGVVAFDDVASWVAPIQAIDNPAEIINRIGTIRAGGGTDILAGVRATADQLEPDPATLKHVVLMTDGQASPAGIPELVREMHDQYGITLSAVALGRGADTNLLQQLAQVGGGRYHFALDPASVPQIFTEETTLATRAYLIEETFFPEQAAFSPILSGIEAVPQLLGYVGATSKEAAQTILISPKKDPLLAAWQYGLGRSVAWTSDATGRWAKSWVAWENFPRFWAQTVRWTINEGAQENVAATVRRDGETVILSLDAQTTEGDYLNGLEMSANVVGPDGETQTLVLRQVAPGRYESAFTPTVEGAYLIRVAGGDGEDAVAETTGWVLAYAPEYRTLEPDPNAMLRLAAITGGSVTAGNPAEAFAHTLAARNAARPAWPWLLFLAALLLPFDVGVRRLVITRYDLARWWRQFAAWRASFGRRPETPLERERPERLTALFRAKDRAGVVKEAGGREQGAGGTADEKQPPMKTDSGITVGAPAGRDVAHPPVSPPTKKPEAVPAGGQLASSLLAKRKARKEK